MSDNSTIEWTTSTWNPVTGCTEVSPGCDHCYAKTFAERWRGTPGHHFENGFDVQLRPDKLRLPLSWRKPRKVFVNSMSDLFHEQVPDEYIAKVFAVMAAAPNHTFQLLTKRHGRMRSLLNSKDFVREVGHHYGWIVDPQGTDLVRPAGWPFLNVWLGVSVEDQKWADIRIPALLDTPAAVRWLSCEPLLGPVDLDLPAADYIGGRRSVDWVVVGGESGPGARPMHPEWARLLREQCRAYGVPFFFKQWGEWGPAPWQVRVCDPAVGWQGTADELAAAKADAEARGATHVYASWAHEHGHELYQPPHKPWSLERGRLSDQHQAPMRRWGKKRAGRELDGRTWDEFPVPVVVGENR